MWGYCWFLSFIFQEFLRGFTIPFLLAVLYPNAIPSQIKFTLNTKGDWIS